MGIPKDGGTIIYADIVDHINKKPYALIVPLYYAEMPQMVASGDMEPIYENKDPKAEARARYPISSMIDMRANSVPFTILKKMDILDIKLHLDAYLKELYLHKDNSEAKSYLEKASILQRELVKACTRVIRNDKVLSDKHKESNLFKRALEGDQRADMIAEEFKYVTPTK